MQDLAKQFVESSAHRAEGTKTWPGQGGVLMVKYLAEEPTPQVFKTRSDKAGPGSQRLSSGQMQFLVAGSLGNALALSGPGGSSSRWFVCRAGALRDVFAGRALGALALLLGAEQVALAGRSRLRCSSTVPQAPLILMCM